MLSHTIFSHIFFLQFVQGYWSHAPTVIIYQTYIKNFCRSVEKTLTRRRKRKTTIQAIPKLFALRANANRKAIAKVFVLYTNAANIFLYNIRPPSFNLTKYVFTEMK